MKPFWKIVAYGNVILCGAAIVAAQKITTPANNGTNLTTDEAPAPDHARLDAIIAQFNDPNFARREAAQKELENSKPDALEFLRIAADKTTDAEMKPRLDHAIMVIQDNASLNPPPISISADGNEIASVASALSDVLDVKIDAGIQNQLGRDPLVFNINARNVPFWEVFFTLSNQHLLSMNQGIRNLEIIVGPNGWRSPVIVGPLAVIPQAITRTRSTQLQALAGEQQQPEIFTLECTAALDPRVPISKYGPVRFTEIIDELGNHLDTKPPGDTLYNARRIVYSPPQHVFLESIPLKVFDKMGKRIVSAKGSVHFVVDVGEERVEIQNARKRVGETFTLESYKLKLTQFEVVPEKIVVPQESTVPTPSRSYLKVLLENVAEPDTSVYADFNKIISLTLTDANGREMAKTGRRITGELSLTLPPDGVGPFKLVLSMSNRTKDLIIPFELKNLILP